MVCAFTRHFRAGLSYVAPPGLVLFYYRLLPPSRSIYGNAFQGLAVVHAERGPSTAHLLSLRESKYFAQDDKLP
jgi:hypothetical protein